MFANPMSSFGFGGFVGANPANYAPATQDYFANLQEQQERRRAERFAQKESDAERSLRLAALNQEGALGWAANRLAQQRLGLDADVAGADANNRSLALALQDKFGTMSENRLSKAGEDENRFRQASLGQSEADRALRERLGLMSENRLSASDANQNRFNWAQLDQQKELANTARPGELLAHTLGLKQLDQQGQQFNRQFTDAPLAERWRNEIARKQQELDQSNADRSFNDLSARDRQTGQLEEKRMGMTERLAGNENQLRREMQRETLAQQLKMWSELSAAEKQQNAQFGQKLAQDLFEFNNVSGNNRFATEAQERMNNNSQDRADWRHAQDLVAGDEDRKQRRELAGNENEIRKLGVLAEMFGRANIPLSEDFQEGLLGSLSQAFPQLRNSPVANPQERETRTMLDNLKAAAAVDAVGEGAAITAPEELHRANWETAKRIDAARRAGHFADETSEAWIKRQDAKTPEGVGTLSQFLQYLERQQKAREKAAEEQAKSGLMRGRTYVGPRW